MTMAAPLKRSHPRDAVATRARIEKESLRLFAEKGVEGATIRDISKAVGVADAALYRYYPSKEDIARDIFTRHYTALADKIRAIGLAAKPIRETIRTLVDVLCNLLDEEPDVFAFILLNQHAHLRYVGPEGNAVEELRRIMQSARERGEISIEDADLAAAMALGAVLQPAVFKLYGRLPGPLKDRAPLLAEAAAKAAGAI
jgi:AcrR family transcriptional regulator